MSSSHRELPTEFQTQMSSWLGVEYPLFAKAFTEPAQRAVRLHRFTAQNSSLNSDPDLASSPYAVSRMPLDLPDALRLQLGDPVPWYPDAFFIPAGSTLGKHVYHEAGAYYIQEPSAMAVVAALDPKPGERILDLAAAPGGKTSAIGRAMRGQGLLVANEIHPVRVLTLAQNVERMGIPAVIVNESPSRLAAAWPHEFDAVLVDAPCSGEGMFRKDDTALHEWSADAPVLCSTRQREILRDAIHMVRPGGRVVYSTCTFNPLENEHIIAWLQREFGLVLMELPMWEGWETGRLEWAEDVPEVRYARRLWPHKGRGEGHFVALLKVPDPPQSVEADFKRNPAADFRGDPPLPRNSTSPRGRANKQGKQTETLSTAGRKDWQSWLTTLVQTDLPASWKSPLLLGNQLFADERQGLNTQGLRVLRPGLALATVAKGRFEPHHSLALALKPSLTFTHPLTERQAISYLSGESLSEALHPGFVLLTYDGLALGWGKSVTGRVNNLYPKGLRRTDLTPIS